VALLGRPVAAGASGALLLLLVLARSAGLLGLAVHGFVAVLQHMALAMAVAFFILLLVLLVSLCLSLLLLLNAGSEDTARAVVAMLGPAVKYCLEKGAMGGGHKAAKRTLEWFGAPGCTGAPSSHVPLPRRHHWASATYIYSPPPALLTQS